MVFLGSADCLLRGLNVLFGETEGSGGILPVRAVAGSDLSTSGCKRGIPSLHACLRVCGFCGTDGFKYMGEMFQFFGLVVVGQVGCNTTS